MLELIGYLVVLIFAAIIAVYIVGLILLSPMLILAGSVWVCSAISKGLAKLEARTPAWVGSYVDIGMGSVGVAAVIIIVLAVTFG